MNTTVVVKSELCMFRPGQGYTCTEMTNVTARLQGCRQQQKPTTCLCCHVRGEGGGVVQP